MNESRDPNVTADSPPAPAESLHADSPRADDPLRTTDHERGSASTDGTLPGAEANAGDLPEVPGFRVLREIARGGMGRVLA
ncbi:MAG TPA: hypothetical protein VKD71_12405, partial [Gemmataceae bacterium]|nr:hypothetical protein [Gemmataceae bacterium]